MYLDGESPTLETPRPVIRTKRDRFHEIAEDVRAAALVTASIMWLLAGAAVLIGATRILTKVW